MDWHSNIIDHHFETHNFFCFWNTPIHTTIFIKYLHRSYEGALLISLPKLPCEHKKRRACKRDFNVYCKRVHLAHLQKTFNLTNLPKKLNLLHWLLYIVIQNYIPLISRVRGPYGKLWTEFFPSFCGSSAKRAGHENKEGKNEDP